MKVKAIGLTSGGLDSTLAAVLMKRVIGANVICVYGEHPFTISKKSGEKRNLKKYFESLGLTYMAIDITNELLEIVKEPKHGYGANMNPCIDCHILLLKKAKEIMEEENAQVVFTGEVAGQRPMSQHKPTLKQVEKESGLTGYLLRPLSAKLLDPTIPEQEGLIDREKLLDISGRSRKRQIELAKEFNVTGYPPPAGGCLLTDPNFAKRLRDLFNNKVYDLNSIQLLKVGRHFWYSTTTKIVVGRDDRDNTIIANLANEDYDVLMEVSGDIPGPLTLVRGEIDAEVLKTAAQYTKRYSDAPEDKEVSVRVWNVKDGNETVIKV